MNLQELAQDLLTVANELNQAVRQFVTDAMTVASNIQITSNTAVLAASDMGAVKAIVAASDAGSQLAKLCNEAADMMNKAANAAELCSEAGMEIAMLASQISSARPLDEMKMISSLLENYNVSSLSGLNSNERSQIAFSANDLYQNSEIVFREIADAYLKADDLFEKMEKLNHQLRTSGELIHALNQTIIKRKSLNPLIPDDLVALINKAAKDIDDAITLNSPALKLVKTIKTAAGDLSGKSADCLDLATGLNKSAQTLK